MSNKRLALNTEGQMTYCSASEENIGKGRCNHIEHQKDGETQQEFLDRTSKPKEINMFKSFLNKFKNNNQENLNSIEKDLDSLNENEFLKNIDNILDKHIYGSNNDQTYEELRNFNLEQNNKLYLPDQLNQEEFNKLKEYADKSNIKIGNDVPGIENEEERLNHRLISSSTFIELPDRNLDGNDLFEKDILKRLNAFDKNYKGNDLREEDLKIKEIDKNKYNHEDDNPNKEKYIYDDNKNIALYALRTISEYERDWKYIDQDYGITDFNKAMEHTSKEFKNSIQKDNLKNNILIFEEPLHQYNSYNIQSAIGSQYELDKKIIDGKEYDYIDLSKLTGNKLINRWIKDYQKEVINNS